MEDKQMKTTLISIAILMVIILIITIILIFNSIKQNVELSSEQVEILTNPRNTFSQTEEGREFKKVQEMNYNSNINRGSVNVIDLGSVNYTDYAKLQFEDAKSYQTEITMKFKGIEKEVVIKLFDDLAPETVNEFINAIRTNSMINKKVASSYNDLLIDASNGANSTFNSTDDKEKNFSVVPYKGALVRKNIDFATSYFSIINSEPTSEDTEYVKSNYISDTLINELNYRGGKVKDLYMQSIVFGQVIKGLEVLEEVEKSMSIQRPTIESIVITKLGSDKS